MYNLLKRRDNVKRSVSNICSENMSILQKKYSSTKFQCNIESAVYDMFRRKKLKQTHRYLVLIIKGKVRRFPRDLFKVIHTLNVIHLSSK